MTWIVVSDRVGAVSLSLGRPATLSETQIGPTQLVCEAGQLPSELFSCATALAETSTADRSAHVPARAARGQHGLIYLPH